jgi:hypothetical protein
MGVIERLAISWKDALIAVVTAIACLCASLALYPQVSVKSLSRATADISADVPPLGPSMASIRDDNHEFQANDDRESQDDDTELCGLLDVRLISSSSLRLSQITLPESVSLSVLTPTQHPLRC